MTTSRLQMCSPALHLLHSLLEGECVAVNVGFLERLCGVTVQPVDVGLFYLHVRLLQSRDGLVKLDRVTAIIKVTQMFVNYVEQFLQALYHKLLDIGVHCLPGGPPDVTINVNFNLDKPGGQGPAFTGLIYNVLAVSTGTGIGTAGGQPYKQGGQQENNWPGLQHPHIYEGIGSIIVL